ncbi:MAG: homoserine dehydrogenase [Anaerolineales bacterium]|jgi:homoserine dehydrogenase
MAATKLAFLGFGHVGQALAALLMRKRAELKERYDITFSAVGIATARHGKIINPAGIDLTGAVQLVRSGNSLNLMTHTLALDAADYIRKCGADVFFENTPVNHEDGQPAVDHLRIALECGMHAITANKGPVVYAYRELMELARAKNRKFLFESTVMDGAPIFSLFRSALPGAQLLGLRGILNSTTNLILTRMEAGESFEAAVKFAQSVGLAETDPSADIDGWDAAIKVAVLVSVLMDVPFTPQQVERTGIRGLTSDQIEAARVEGKRWKLVCSAERTSQGVHARVAPELVLPSSPLFSVGGASSIVEFKTDVLSSLSIVEGNPGPETTAYGLLTDFIHAVKD